MKNLILLIALFCTTISFAQKSRSKNKQESPIVIVDQMPEFKGGEEAMHKFIRKNIVYPQWEKESGITGTCYVTFVVEKNGRITGAKVLRGVSGGPGCDKEALRVVGKMPKWKAGKQNGKKVRVQFNLPIKYVLK